MLKEKFLYFTEKNVFICPKKQPNKNNLLQLP